MPIMYYLCVAQVLEKNSTVTAALKVLTDIEKIHCKLFLIDLSKALAWFSISVEQNAERANGRLHLCL